MSVAPASPAPAAGPTAGDREARLAAWLVAGAMVLGAVAQIRIPPGPLTLVAATGIASLVVLGVSFVVPGRLRTTLAGFRFTSTLLIALAVFAVIGTLVLQGKPHALYLQRYGAFGPLIVALRLDDIFHGLPFAGLTALFGAAILSSASLRWPISARRAGFFVAHVGLMISGAGAATSSVFSVRGRIDLMAGGDVATVARVTKGGAPSGTTAPLGFELKLDQFDLVRYESEYRVGYYEKKLVKRDGAVVEDFALKTSFDPCQEHDASRPRDTCTPDLTGHRLPAGDSFRIKAVYPDFAPVTAVAPVASGGQPALEATLGGRTAWLLPGEALASPDGLSAVLFGVECPAAPPGALTAFLVCAGPRQVVVHTGDGQQRLPLVEGQALAGGAVRLGRLLPSAARTQAPGSRGPAWNNPAVVLETSVGGRVQEHLVLAAQPRGVFLSERAALVFEKRAEEVKAFRSHVTARRGSTVERGVVAVNEPFDFGGWTFYQVNYDPREPNYSGLEAVRDPGVTWVFLGFVLICLGVGYMFYVEPRLRGGIERPEPAGPGAAA